MPLQAHRRGCVAADDQKYLRTYSVAVMAYVREIPRGAILTHSRFGLGAQHKGRFGGWPGAPPSFPCLGGVCAYVLPGWCGPASGCLPAAESRQRFQNRLLAVGFPFGPNIWCRVFTCSFVSSASLGNPTEALM